MGQYTVKETVQSVKLAPLARLDRYQGGPPKTKQEGAEASPRKLESSAISQRIAV
jgi:hypothetical protein